MPYVPATLGLLPIRFRGDPLAKTHYGDKKEGYRPTIPWAREKFNADL